MSWLTQHWTQVVPAALGFLALYTLLPRIETDDAREKGSWNWSGILLGLAALIAAGFLWVQPTKELVPDILFYFFAAAAIVSAVNMITNTNPVYAALWFALVTLSVCGLFLLQSAPFLAAATVIVYAGAIIVTFLFVIMLARQAGSAEYDRHAREPFAASFTAFFLLMAILYTLSQWRGDVLIDSETTGAEIAAIENAQRFLTVPGRDPNPLSQPADPAQFGQMRGLGRSLFGDYLFAVELAGTLLLVASIGAILIAPRRSQGNA
ncbi:MAG: NADH-quinone oxidoreductase subunit J [Planctomycetaceae bacterium]